MLKIEVARTRNKVARFWVLAPVEATTLFKNRCTHPLASHFCTIYLSAECILFFCVKVKIANYKRISTVIREVLLC